LQTLFFVCTWNWTAVPKDIPPTPQIKLCYDSKKEQSDNRALWPLLGFIIFTIDGKACK
jgi:hypothetical protein